MATPQSGRIAQFYRRLLSLKERFSPDVQETILPTMELLNPADFDLYRPRGSDLVSADIPGATAGVGVFAETGISAVAPGKLFIPLYFIITGVTTPGQFIRLSFFSPPPIAIVNNFFLADQRGAKFNLFGAPTALGGQAGTGFGTQTVAVARVGPFAALWNTSQALGQIIPAPLMVLIGPGPQAVFSTDQANTTFRMTIVGFERAYEVQEAF